MLTLRQPVMALLERNYDDKRNRTLGRLLRYKAFYSHVESSNVATVYAKAALWANPTPCSGASDPKLYHFTPFVLTRTSEISGRCLSVLPSMERIEVEVFVATHKGESGTTVLIMRDRS